MSKIGGLAFIGAGKMAEAFASGLKRAGFPAESMTAYDVSVEAAERFSSKTGASKTADFKALLSGADTVLLAVKPQHAAAALASAKPFLTPGHLLISIVAGMKISSISAASGLSRVVRVMPNTPALLGMGASAYALSPAATPEDAAKAEELLAAAGEYCRVDEKLMDAVTGLSGSGPAYVFEFIMGLADGGVHEGLPRDVALKLAALTVKGAAEMVLRSTEHPAILRDNVVSPGGTTARGLAVLERGAFRSLAAGAVSAATARSAELGAK